MSNTLESLIKKYQEKNPINLTYMLSHILTDRYECTAYGITIKHTTEVDRHESYNVIFEYEGQLYKARMYSNSSGEDYVSGLPTLATAKNCNTNHL
jgi:hypothetical protein